MKVYLDSNLRVYCRKCRQPTNHVTLSKIAKEYDQTNTPEMQIDWARGEWQIIECKGCNEITFREAWITSEDFDPVTGEPAETVTYYPMAEEGILPVKRFNNVPGKIERIYEETVNCYNYGIHILCTAGLRAIIEGICLDQKIKDGPVEYRDKSGTTQIKRMDNLQGKIEGLKEIGLLSKQNANILHKHRFLGNEAIHELEQPSKEQLKLAIEIIEHTLEDLYELKDKAKKLHVKKSAR